jgi:hypothetical protein
MTTRQRIQRQQFRQELRDTLKDILAGLIIGAGFVVIFFLS